MKGNGEYFERYFSLCELFVEKDLVTQKLWDSEDKTGHLTPAHYQAKRDIEALNALIREEENHLRCEVREAEADGEIFSFEVFAREREMDDFEKRLALFFLHLDLFCSGNVAFPRRKLAPILDCEATPASRSKILLDLFPGSPLFKKGIISEEDGPNEVRLAVPMRDALRKLVSGGVVPLGADQGKYQQNICGAGIICDPEYSIKDVVLPGRIKDDVLMHLDTHERLSELGGMEKVHRGRGLCMLFYGPPGTGKSMMSHAIAGHLKKKVLQASYPQILSRWSGETEKNISALFKAARENDCVLCVDESDSLVFDRKSAQRSWEVSQTNTFLEEVEKFDGVLIMTTNMQERMDPALERRVAIRVRFENPTSEVREGIWRAHIPSKVEVDKDIDWQRLAREYSFAGGYIKNAVLSALRQMLARKGERLMMEDLIFGAETERRGTLRESSRGPIGFGTQGSR